MWRPRVSWSFLLALGLIMAACGGGDDSDGPGDDANETRANSSATAETPAGNEAAGGDADGASLTVEQVRLLISPFDDDVSLFTVAIEDGTVLSMEGRTDAAGAITLDRIVMHAGEQSTTMDLNAAELPVRIETVDAAAGTTA